MKLNQILTDLAAQYDEGMFDSDAEYLAAITKAVAQALEINARFWAEPIDREAIARDYAERISEPKDKTGKDNASGHGWPRSNPTLRVERDALSRSEWDSLTNPWYVIATVRDYKVWTRLYNFCGKTSQIFLVSVERPGSLNGGYASIAAAISMKGFDLNEVKYNNPPVKPFSWDETDAP